MSNFYEINYAAFESLSRLFEHIEIKRNLIKFRALRNALNLEQRDKENKDKHNKTIESLKAKKRSK